jgi:hypothetical protein
MNGWHRGPPPSVGWWPTKHGQYVGMDGIRWWDGEQWSFAPTHDDPDNTIDWCAQQRSAQQDWFWSARPASWPKRSFT